MAVAKTCYILLLPVANPTCSKPYLWHKHYSHRCLRNCQNNVFWCWMLGFMFLVSLLQHRAVVGVIPNPSLPRRCGSCQGKSELLGSTWKYARAAFWLGALVPPREEKGRWFQSLFCQQRSPAQHRCCFGGFCFEHLPEVVLGCAHRQLFNHSRNHSAEHPSGLINHSLLRASIPIYCIVPAAPEPFPSSNF